MLGVWRLVFFVQPRGQMIPNVISENDTWYLVPAYIPLTKSLHARPNSTKMSTPTLPVSDELTARRPSRFNLQQIRQVAAALRGSLLLYREREHVMLLFGPHNSPRT